MRPPSGFEFAGPGMEIRTPDGEPSLTHASIHVLISIAAPHSRVLKL
jgi:hypothetical protein